MIISRQEAANSAAAVRRARRDADRDSEALALLDLGYHRRRHRLARRAAARLRRDRDGPGGRCPRRRP